MSTASGLNQLEVYQKGTEAWFEDDAEGWVLGKLTAKAADNANVKMHFTLENGKV
ncbi:hypothetical protein HK096_010283 [Nowakowskiella sp. JEL0078]|nr:hypothetical protein HK096_010283 [Nowakowskiella sp. JEL0078]